MQLLRCNLCVWMVSNSLTRTLSERLQTQSMSEYSQSVCNCSTQRTDAVTFQTSVIKSCCPNNQATHSVHNKIACRDPAISSLPVSHVVFNVHSFHIAGGNQLWNITHPTLYPIIKNVPNTHKSTSYFKMKLK